MKKKRKINSVVEKFFTTHNFSAQIQKINLDAVQTEQNFVLLLMLKTYQNSFKLTSGTCLKHSTYVANEVCFQIPTFSILFTNGNLQESLYLKNTKFQAKSWQHCIQTYLICIAARRPPVEETTSFLNSLLASHGPNYLEKLFGSKARHRLRELGGVNQVAIALSGRYL